MGRPKGGNVGVMSARVAAAVDRRRIGDAPFCVIASDCWGGEVYRRLVRPYNTPFVGLYLEQKDFAQMLTDLRGYVTGELRFVDARASGVNHPVGVLGGDVRVHFLHYASEAEAREKWENRRSRIDWDHVRVVWHTDDGALANVVRQRAPGALILGPRGVPGVLGVRDHVRNGSLLYNLSLQEFDVVAWLRDGVQRPPRVYQRVLHGVSRWKRRLEARRPVRQRPTVSTVGGLRRSPSLRDRARQSSRL